MNEEKARELFEAARDAVGDGADWADINQEETWNGLDEREFLREYCWVVFASGFSVSILEKRFGKIGKVFRDFEPAAVAGMKPVKVENLPIRNKSKADGFLKGAKTIHEEGWKNFKARVAAGGSDILTELPYIGDITKDHLAKNIGLEDTAKADVHLVRCAEECSATVEELVGFLADEYGMTKHKVDAVLWEYRRRSSAEMSGETEAERWLREQQEEMRTHLKNAKSVFILLKKKVTKSTAKQLLDYCDEKGMVVIAPLNPKDDKNLTPPTVVFEIGDMEDNEDHVDRYPKDFPVDF